MGPTACDIGVLEQVVINFQRISGATLFDFVLVRNASKLHTPGR